jgi:hypothetical protein
MPMLKRKNFNKQKEKKRRNAMNKKNSGRTRAAGRHRSVLGMTD